jgi:hypothetical protein
MTTEIRDVATIPTTLEALQTYDDDQFNMLNMPSIIVDDGDHRLVVQVIRIDPHDRQMVYPSPANDDTFCLHWQALKTLASAAGVQFSPSTIHYDAENNPTVSLTGRWESQPGQYSTAPGSYRMDIQARIDELTLAVEKKPERTEKQRKAKEYARKRLSGEIIRVKRFALQMAETGAMARCLRTLLNVRNSYTVEELRLPFVVARLSYAPTNPLLKRALGVAAQDDMAALFGDGPDVDPALLQAAEVILTAAGRGQRIDEPPPISETVRELEEAQAEVMEQETVFTEEAEAEAEPEPETEPDEEEAGEPAEPESEAPNKWSTDEQTMQYVRRDLDKKYNGLTEEAAAKLLGFESLQDFPGGVGIFWRRLAQLMGA